MIRPLKLLIGLLLVYAALMGPFSTQMRQRPFFEKIGYVPEASVLRIVSSDQKQLVAAGLIFRTLMYYGIFSESDQKQEFSPDFSGIERTLVASTFLDPYNMDAYYVGQAILVWDLHHFIEANELLDYGMQYRRWDFYLPFFAGFNSAYFLKDFEQAAHYYRRAAELSGSDIFMKLSGRYLYETGATDQAIAYLTMMVQGTRNAAVRESLSVRLEAFKNVRVIELARDRFQQATGQLPKDLDVLLSSGFLVSLPHDPYGGTFFIAVNGQVRSTSGFSPIASKKDNKE